MSLVQPLPERPTDRHFLLHRDHSRHFEQNLYVYPVLARRSRGISVGINLNPDKVCNFDCVYCQVDRRTVPQVADVNEEQLLQELEETLDLVLSGRLYLDKRFASVPDPLRRLNDIAFSGDGEPTTYPGFARIVQDVAAIKTRRKLEEIKLVLITNATMLHRPYVKEALATLDASNGEIWAKLDAGTEAYYRTINQTKIPLRRVLANILDAARARPVVIQSLLLSLNGQGPSELEIKAYCRRLARSWPPKDRSPECNSTRWPERPPWRRPDPSRAKNWNGSARSSAAGSGPPLILTTRCPFRKSLASFLGLSLIRPWRIKVAFKLLRP